MALCFTRLTNAKQLLQAPKHNSVSFSFIYIHKFSNLIEIIHETLTHPNTNINFATAFGIQYSPLHPPY